MTEPDGLLRTIVLTATLLAGCGERNGVFAEFDVPGGAPSMIVAGPDGNLWFTETGGIGRITTSGSVTEFPLASGTPAGITGGPDGNIWFTVPSAQDPSSSQGNMVGQFDVRSGSVTLFPTRVSGGDPYDVTAGPDGNVWFTEGAQGTIGRVSVNGDVLNVPLPRRGPLGIAAGVDGNIWFSTLGGVGRIAPASLAVDWFGNEGGYTLAISKDGFVWFSNSGRAEVGRVSPAGEVASFPLPDNMRARGMTVTPDGNVWFAATYSAPSQLADRIGRIDHGGTVEYFSIPTAHGAPLDIAHDVDGALWFTEPVANKIGRYQP
jgi:streptogramin lyase